MQTIMQPNTHEESRQLANKAGVDASDFSKIAAIGLPLILQGMNRNNQNKSGLESFNQALNDHQTRNNYASFSQFSQNMDPQEGDKILDHVFHDNRQPVNNGLAETLGVSPDTVQSVLTVLAPLAIKYLADRKRENNLDSKGIQQETQSLTREATKQAKDLNETHQTTNISLLDNLLQGLDGNTISDEKDSGLLGSLFNLFK